MPKLRYTIAALFFAASVGCLALWGRSQTRRDQVVGLEFGVSSAMGVGSARTLPTQFTERGIWKHSAGPITDSEREFKDRFIKTNGYFTSIKYGGDGIAVYFPLWYPALIFALAGVATLRFRRQFSIRSALIGLAVVAMLLGMVVAL